jgi:hypothetical protein
MDLFFLQVSHNALHGSCGITGICILNTASILVECLKISDINLKINGFKMCGTVKHPPLI